MAEVERARAQFRSFLARNPNHFGNLRTSAFKPVEKMVANTRYEQLTCLGYNPQRSVLEATVEIKRATGYGGGLCSDGSNEYVRFYVDYHDGNGWQDAGMVAVDVHDVPTAKDCADRPTKPLVYVLTQELDPARKTCSTPVLPAVRAILSWDAPPPANDAGHQPVWGNVLDHTIQIAPKPPRFIGDLPQLFTAAGELELPQELLAIANLELPEPPPEPEPLPFEALAGLYAPQALEEQGAEAVEPQRFGAAELQVALAAPTVDEGAFSKKLALWKKAGIDWSEAIDAFQALDGNTNYEQLECLGLDIRRDLLVATLRIKRPNGYLGNLCQPGSREYVAFWADWNDDCNWQPLGIRSVRVHDIAAIPPHGLCYTVVLPVDLDDQRASCTVPRIGRVRAVMSWNQAPDLDKPFDVPRWGNALESHVLIRPLDDRDLPGKINIIGGIGVPEIDTAGGGLTIPDARFALQGTLADGEGRRCPFGRRLVIQGPPLLGQRYRVVVRQGGGPLAPLTQRVWVVDDDGFGSWHDVGADGYFAYLSKSANFLGVLAYWDSHEENGLWQLRLEIKGQAPGPWLRVRIDNTEPTATLLFPGGDCKSFNPGAQLAGTFIAQDPYFGAYSLGVLPSSVGPNAPSPSSGTSATPNAGTGWTLDTTGMSPCGYVLKLWVRDRSILNSGPGSHNRSSDDTGFCLLTPE